MIKKSLLSLALALGLCAGTVQAAEHYSVDTEGMHASINFRIKHLGYSWLHGRFNHFSGDFDFDAENPENNRVSIEIDIASIDSNHAERDKHLRSERFFDAEKFPTASFISTGWEDLGEGKAMLTGVFSLRGIAKDVSIDVVQTGTGDDPWGGYRRGFEGKTVLHLSDFEMQEGPILGPLANDIEILLSMEGIRQ